MLIKDRQRLDHLIADLSKLISEKKTELFALNRNITLDTQYWIEEDYETVKSYLESYTMYHRPIELINRIKPKGKILIILSYNEPFILSIIPVLNALVIGNDVTLKPSQEAEDFTKIIWQKSGLAEKYGLKLKIISPKTHEEVANFIQSVRAVYFFGSYKVAQILAKICGEHYVEFYPEIETSDIKIFNKDSPSIKNDVLLTLRESFSHSGQICQRIQGIFVHKHLYNDYVKTLKRAFTELCQSEDLNKFIDKNYVSARTSLLKPLLSDIEKSKPVEVIKIEVLPLLVIKPKTKSEFVKNAYFLPVLWISSFDSEEELIKMLNLRKFFLGLNIQSNDNKFVDHIINNTKFTRYTVNTSHINIRPQENWGGSWPSGFSGYRDWIEHFSDGYIIIDLKNTFCPSEAALTPEFKVFKTIKLGTALKTAEDFRRALKKSGFRTTDWGNDILDNSVFAVVAEETEVDLVVVSVAEMGFRDRACRRDIYKKAQKLGLEICPPEVGPQLRLQYKNQPRDEWLLVAMEFITDSGGDLRGFSVGHDGLGLWLDGRYGGPGDFWRGHVRWVFVRRK